MKPLAINLAILAAISSSVIGLTVSQPAQADPHYRHWNRGLHRGWDVRYDVYGRPFYSHPVYGNSWAPYGANQVYVNPYVTPYPYGYRYNPNTGGRIARRILDELGM